MLLEEVNIKSFEREDKANIRLFAEEGNQANFELLVHPNYRNMGFKIHRYMWKMDYPLNDAICNKTSTDEYSIRQLNEEHILNYIDIMNAGFKKEGDVLYNENSFRTLLSNPDEQAYLRHH